MHCDINIKHLEYFIKVAKLGSINKAAQALFISQPYLGKIIHDLEENFGSPLLNRSNQGVTLTPEGEEFMRHATNILREMRHLQSRSEKKEEDFDHLSVSMTKFSHVMESFIDVVLRHQDQPSFTHRLYDGNPDDVIEDVLSGRAQVGIFHFDSKRRREIEENLLSKGLTYRFLAYVEPHIVISKNHPLVLEKKPINLHTLSDYGFIRYLGHYDDLVYSLFGSELRNNENNSSKVLYVSARATLMRLISESDFYSIGIHDFDKQDSAYQAISIPISDCDFMFEFGYVMMEGVSVSAITDEFISEVKKRLD